MAHEHPDGTRSSRESAGSRRYTLSACVRSDDFRTRCCTESSPGRWTRCSKWKIQRPRDDRAVDLQERQRARELPQRVQAEVDRGLACEGEYVAKAAMARPREQADHHEERDDRERNQSANAAFQGSHMTLAAYRSPCVAPHGVGETVRRFAADRERMCGPPRVHEVLSGDAWSAPTPCTEWTVREFVGHVVSVHRHVAAGLDASAPPPPATDPDRVAAWRATAEVLLALADPSGRRRRCRAASLRCPSRSSSVGCSAATPSCTRGTWPSDRSGRVPRSRRRHLPVHACCCRPTKRYADRAASARRSIRPPGPTSRRASCASSGAGCRGVGRGPVPARYRRPFTGRNILVICRPYVDGAGVATEEET